MVCYWVNAFVYFMSHGWQRIPDIDFLFLKSEVYLRSEHNRTCTQGRRLVLGLFRWHTDSPSLWCQRVLSGEGQTDRWCYRAFSLGVISPYRGKATTGRVSASIKWTRNIRGETSTGDKGVGAGGIKRVIHIYIYIYFFFLTQCIGFMFWFSWRESSWSFPALLVSLVFLKTRKN